MAKNKKRRQSESSDLNPSIKSKYPASLTGNQIKNNDIIKKYFYKIILFMAYLSCMGNFSWLF